MGHLPAPAPQLAGRAPKPLAPPPGVERAKATLPPRLIVALSGSGAGSAGVGWQTGTVTKPPAASMIVSLTQTGGRAGGTSAMTHTSLITGAS